MAANSKQCQAYLLYKWYSFLPPNLKIIFKSSFGINGLSELNSAYQNGSHQPLLANAVLNFLNSAYNTQHTSIFKANDNLLEILKNQATSALSLNFNLGDVLYAIFPIRLLTTISSSIRSNFEEHVASLDDKNNFINFILSNYYTSRSNKTEFELNLLRNVSINGRSIISGSSETSVNLTAEQIGVFNCE